MCVCFNRSCRHNNPDTLDFDGIKVPPSENHCELFEDATECEYFMDAIPIHDTCGLPVELCVCPDAKVKFIEGKFVDLTPSDKGKR